MTPREADFHRVGLEKFQIFNLIFGIFDATRGWFPPCWTRKNFGIWIWHHERLISTVLDLKIFRIFNLIFGVYDATRGWFPLEKFSDFQFDFWSLWYHERLISTVLDLKNFRIFNLIFGVYDATRGWFPLCWTWKFVEFSIYYLLFLIWFLESLTPREADFYRVGLEIFFLVFNVIFVVLESTRGWFLPWWNWKVFGFSIWFL